MNRDQPPESAVGPGFINTPLLEANLDQAALEYLFSDAASFVTGSYHLVAGGYTAQ